MLELTRSRFLRRFCAGLAATAILAACGGGPAPSSNSGTTDAPSTPEETFDDEDFTLIIGVDAAAAPFSSEEGGELQGFNVDLMNAIGEDSGYIMEFRALPSEELIAAVSEGTIDAAIGTLTITAESAAVVHFTRPYYRVSEDTYYGIAISYETDGIYDVVNGSLGSLFNLGTFDELYEKWFEMEPPELPVSYKPKS